MSNSSFEAFANLFVAAVIGFLGGSIFLLKELNNLPLTLTYISLLAIIACVLKMKWETHKEERAEQKLILSNQEKIMEHLGISPDKKS